MMPGFQGPPCFLYTVSLLWPRQESIYAVIVILASPLSLCLACLSVFAWWLGITTLDSGYQGQSRNRFQLISLNSTMSCLLYERMHQRPAIIRISGFEHEGLGFKLGTNPSQRFCAC